MKVRKRKPLFALAALLALSYFFNVSKIACPHKYVELKRLSRREFAPAGGRDKLFRERINETPRRSGVGILMFAYGANKTTYEIFKEQAVEAARLFRHVSPDIQLALVSSFRDDESHHVFDHQIVVREDHNFAGGNIQGRSDGLDRQWLTRILYLTATPFQVTLAYDANIIPCGDVMPAIRSIVSSNFDLAVASQGNTAGDISPHNFAIALKWNELISHLFDVWFMTQVRAGVALDDQHTLQRAIATTQERFPSLKIRTMNPSMAAAFTSSDASKGVFPRETRVLTGKVLVVHGNPHHAIFWCKGFNTATERRQIIFDGRNTEVALNGHQCSLRLNGTNCKYVALWQDEQGSLLVPPNF